MTTEATVIYDSMECYTDEDGNYDEELSSIYWEDLAYELKRLINNADNGIILDGTVQFWDGCGHGGAFAGDWDEFLRILNGYEVIVSAKGRQLFFDLVHHDGTHSFEMRRVTEKGYAWYNNNPYLHTSDYAQHLASVKGYTKMMFDKNFVNYSKPNRE